MNFTNSMKQTAGLKYRLGAQYSNEEKEVDCFGMIRRFLYLRYRASLPLEFEGRPDTEYYEEWQGDKLALINILIDYFSLHFSPVALGYNVAGDIIVADEGLETVTIGIYGGNNAMLVSAQGSGTVMVAISSYTISRIFRWAVQ
jgi:hypothetical protein